MDIDKIYFDGEHQSNKIISLQKDLTQIGNRKVELITGKNLDKRYNFVNQADLITYYFFRFYEKNGVLSQKENPYEDTLIRPNFNNYTFKIDNDIKYN